MTLISLIVVLGCCFCCTFGHLKFNIDMVYANFATMHSRNGLFFDWFLDNPPAIVRSVLVSLLPVRIVNVASIDVFVLINNSRLVMSCSLCSIMMAMMVMMRSGSFSVMLDNWLRNKLNLVRFIFNHHRFRHFNYMVRFSRSLMMVFVNIDYALWLMSMMSVVTMVSGVRNVLNCCIFVLMHVMHVLFDHIMVMILPMYLLPGLKGRLFVRRFEMLVFSMSINLAFVVRVVIRQVNGFVDGVFDPRVRRHIVHLIILVV